MKILGIVAEYNPYHNGHRLHIQKSKALTHADAVIVVMSGNFVQRGEPAIADKWIRTKMALADGADLVLELPVLYATSSAEFFAHSAVKLLHDTGIVDFLCFGSESGCLSPLLHLAHILSHEDANFSLIIKKKMKQGMSYPSARMETLKQITGDASLRLSTPNDILGVEYLKALQKLSSPIRPFTIKRETASYHSQEIHGEIASATAIRKQIIEQNFSILSSVLPERSFPFLMDALEKGMAPVVSDTFSPMLQYCLRMTPLNELSQILDIKEGLENRIQKISETNETFQQIVQNVKSKRYPHTSIQRALLHILLNIKMEDLFLYNQSGYCPYLRILGIRQESKILLSRLSKEASLPILTNPKKAPELLNSRALSLFELEKRATDLYFLGIPNASCHQYGLDYTMPMIKM